MNLQAWLELIELKLGIQGMLKIHNGKIIIPNDDVLTKKFIKENHLDDLFEFHSKTLVFKTRFLHLVGEITDRKVLTGHYFLELR